VLPGGRAAAGQRGSHAAVLPVHLCRYVLTDTAEATACSVLSFQTSGNICACVIHPFTGW
jgi:hypothetical protein